MLISIRIRPIHTSAYVLTLLHLYIIPCVVSAGIRSGSSGTLSLT
nr:MAG TPA: hypothetical protein [Caudoviricetes sp.]